MQRFAVQRTVRAISSITIECIAAQVAPFTTLSMRSISNTKSIPFYGNTVVRAAFILAMFGWGVGFYGPPIFLHAVIERTGWSLSMVSAAITFHFLFGAGVVAFLPRIHRRFGVPRATAVGAIVLALGIVGWACVTVPWQLFVAAMFTGAGWVPLGAAGINAIVSPWFVNKRPMALAKAYNGASVGGMVFSPLWVALIHGFGFAAASMLVGLIMIAIVLMLALRVISRTPADRGQHADGVAPEVLATQAIASEQKVAAHLELWRNRAFVTLAAAMALGLFAQIGLLAQLFSMMVPIFGAPMCGWIMALATGCGMGGRLVMARLLGVLTDRRYAASASYAIQALGTLLLWMAGLDQPVFIVLGVALFGLGIGNATSLPPLIAQTDFARVDVPRVVARCVAFSQAMYAFAPVVLSVLLVNDGHGVRATGIGTHTYFVAVFLIQCLAIVCMLAGKRRSLATR
jgi:Na+/melibiose symporter-like transporter